MQKSENLCDVIRRPWFSTGV